MKSQSILAGRHERIHWECVESEKVRIKRALLDLPGTSTPSTGTTRVSRILARVTRIVDSTVIE